MSVYVSPVDDRARPAVPAAPRLSSLEGQRIGLLDIAKPRSREFLDRFEELLRDRAGVEVVRLRKETPSRPAAPDVLSEAQRCGAVLVALAD